MQKLILVAQRRALLNNGGWNAAARKAGNKESDFRPVVKLFTPWGGATWLLSELDPSDPDRAFGLCDSGQGYPELGYVSLAELASLRGPGGLRVERDQYFRPRQTLLAYARDARAPGRILA